MCLILLASLVWLTSCEDYGKDRTVKSGGGLDELMIILADSQYQGPLADTLIRYLNSPYPGLPQFYEPLFPIKIRSFARYKAGSEVFHKYRNLVFATAFKEEQDPENLYVQEHIGEEAFQAAFQSDTNWYTIKHDEFAEPQLTIYLYAPTYQQLYDRFVRYHQSLYDEIRAVETARLRKQLYVSGQNVKAEAAINKQFGFHVKIPEDYLLARNDSNLIIVTQAMTFRDKKDNSIKEIKRNLVFTSFQVSQEELAKMTYPSLGDIQTVGYPIVLQDAMTGRVFFGADSTYSVHSDTKNSLVFQDTLIAGWQTGIAQPRALADGSAIYGRSVPHLYISRVRVTPSI